MTRLRRRRAAQTRRRTRLLLLIGLLGWFITAIVFFAAGLIPPGLAATTAGLATLIAAGRNAHPANWTPEDRDTESR